MAPHIWGQSPPNFELIFKALYFMKEAINTYKMIPNMRGLSKFFSPDIGAYRGVGPTR